MTLRTLHSGAVPGPGVSAAVDTEGELSSAFTLTVAVGTPVVSVEGSPDGVLWASLGPALAPGTTRRYLLPRFLRAAWTGSGTFTLTAETRVLFAAPQDVRDRARAANDEGPLAEVTDVKLESFIAQASAAVLSAFQTGQFKLPVYAVGEDTRACVMDLACLYAMRSIGFAPDGEVDLMVKAHDEAMAWLRRVAKEGLRPVGIVDAAPAVYNGGAALAFRPRRR